MGVGNVARRKNLRFNSDDSTMAKISSDLEDQGMEKSFTGLSINESFRGVSVVVASHNEVMIGERYLVKVGKLSPIVGELRWIKKLDDDVFRLGFFFEDL